MGVFFRTNSVADVYKPPLTCITCPLIYSASSLARNSARAATSSGFPNLPVMKIQELVF
jgi:hypothetical protein